MKLTFLPLEDRLTPTTMVSYILPFHSPTTDNNGFIRAIEYTDKYADDYIGPRRPTTVLQPTVQQPESLTEPRIDLPQIFTVPINPNALPTYCPAPLPTQETVTPNRLYTTDDMTNPLPRMLFEKLGEDRYRIARLKPDLGFCGNGIYWTYRGIVRGEGTIVNAAEFERLKSLTTSSVTEVSDDGYSWTDMITGRTSTNLKADGGLAF